VKYYSYDFCLFERIVTLEFVQLEALMALENVRKGLYKEQAVFVENTVTLKGDSLNVYFCN